MHGFFGETTRTKNNKNSKWKMYNNASVDSI